MMLNLDATLGKHIKKRGPSNPMFIRYLFLTWGIGYTEFNQYPLPYIFDMLETHKHIKDKEEKELKKSRKGRM
jgi:hypothetical protein